MKVGISIQKSLVKELLLCFFISIIPIKIYASTNSDFSMQKLRSELDYMFTGINRDSVPTGLLKDYAIEYENLDKYERNKELNDNNLCDVLSYAKILNTLKSASLFDNPFKSFEAEIKQSKSLSSDIANVRLSVTLYEYAQIKSNALTDNLISYKQGKVYCSTKNAYQLRRVCAGCALDNKKTANNIVFSLPQSFILTNINIS